MNGTLTNFRRYAFDSPAGNPSGRAPRFYVVRADVTGDPDRRRTFYWEVPNPAQPFNRRANLSGHPSEFGVPFRDCLYNAGPLRYALDTLPPVIVWAEGEKDADAARRAYGVPATTHFAGAGKATDEQAAHFAPLATRKARRAGTRVLIVADRDDAGLACAARRYRLLRAVGLNPSQLHVVRAADAVLGGGGGCGLDVRCECDVACLPPSKQWIGADLADHAAAGYGLRDLVRVPRADLRAAAAATAARGKQGWVYGAPEEPPADRR
ncbi:toprim domain-containing protein [Pseudonocardia sp.]|uniref:toprim domain-containing protein n=1 Tax=Pseudonocardia sp. TaxID=60912 RepID=UPI0026085604|nr:toprim domain-containing protein [Pseudonocardia sp.]